MTSKNRYVLSLTIIFFTIYWLIIFYNSDGKDLIASFINNIDDWQYYTLIYNFANFNFTPTYDPTVEYSKFLSFPIYSILYHALFFKIFNIYGFVIVSFLIILIFFYLLISFLQKIGINIFYSALIATIIFCLGNFIDYFNFDIAYYKAIGELYGLRIPRPSITHLYFFLFLLLLINTKSADQFNIKKLSLIGATLALMWGSFYYNLAISAVIFLFYYTYIIISDKKFKISTFIKNLITLGFFVILFSVPLLIILLKSEPDYLVRVGIIDLNFTKKKILILHFLSKIIDIKFLIIFGLITIINVYLNIHNKYEKRTINCLYFIFLSSFMAPILFIVLAPSISEIYHFSNSLVALSFFVLLVYSFMIINTLSSKYSIFNKYLSNFLIIFLIFVYSFTMLDDIKKRSSLNSNKHIYDFVNFFKSKNFSKNIPILTFDGKIQTNLILNGYNNFNIVLGVNTSINDSIMEEKIITIFKYLKLDVEDYKKFIENKKTGWRFINPNIGSSFYMKYQANNLKTFNDSMDFNDEELRYIKKSSPLHSQQLIIPQFEINRLILEFLNFNKKINIEPKLIIVNKNDKFLQNLNINGEVFCRLNINETYFVYIDKTINSCT